MPLQTDRLVMISLGILNDTPPVDHQPPLVNGIHLRWAFQREAGFPWYGYYLFRRPHEKRGESCVASNFAAHQPGSLSSTRWQITEGVFHSDADLILTEDSGQAGRLGLDLAGRRYVQFDLPAGEPAFRLDLDIGFRLAVQAEHCVDLPVDDLDHLSSQFTIDGVKFEVELLRRPFPPMVTSIIVTATLPQPSSSVRMDLTAAQGVRPVMEALDDNGQVLASLVTDPPESRPMSFRLASPRPAQQFRLRARGGVALIHRLCYALSTRSGENVRVTAFDGEMPVAAETLQYVPGSIALASLWFDRITSVRISASEAALLDLCIYPVAMGIDQDWQPAPGFPQPLSLPITHPDYPARPGVANLAADWGEAKVRITYGLPDPWEGNAFEALYEQLQALVDGGPPGPPENAMDHPERAMTGLQGVEDSPGSGEQPPTIPQVHPLDMVVLGAVHPALAQMIGLYWTDQSAHTAGAYDYLLVADHIDFAKGKATNVLKRIQEEGFDQMDAWAVFNRRIESIPPLDPPQRVRVYALPGGTFRGRDAQIYQAPGNAGLTWPVERNNQGYLRPGHPVMYHVWRDRQGNASTPSPHSEANELATDGRPLLLLNPPEILDQPVQYPADWPPFRLRWTDFGLQEGWYGYQVNAIDLFGRFSPKSGFAEWWQWALPLQRLPWYYIKPPGARTVHPSSVRILDKLAPPPPLAVEAYALDPADPLLVQDQAYKDWLATLPQASQGSLVGLRVRWWWTAKQQRQAPDTAEFRLYWNPGSGAPVNWHDPAAWQLRFFACPYSQQVTILAQDEVATLTQNGQPVQTVIHRKGDRRYEIFLPIVGQAGPFSNGVPLVPSLADPIAYANVSVTAADAAVHSPDRWRSAGPLAGRTGNESQPAAPQRVYRVWRQKPEPPPSLPEPGRHYATPADYHSRSYFTYQWQPAADLWVHIYRALDDSVIKRDWFVRITRHALDPDPAHRQHKDIFPSDWALARRQAAAARLNAIKGPGDYPALDVDSRDLLKRLPGNEGRAESDLPQWDWTVRSSRRDLAASGTKYFPTDWDVTRQAAVVTALDAIAGFDDYGKLTDDALRVLAGLPGNESAFSQLTTAPLGSSTRSLKDTLDGRASNRFFYRAAYVDEAQNRSALSLASAPVFLPDVTPPKPPVIGKVVGGEREIILTWASNREPDLAEYRVYRAESAEAARDIRLMLLVHTEKVTESDPNARPATVEWPDTPVPGLKDFWYCVTAVDRMDPVDARGGGGNESQPSTVVRARAQQPVPGVPVVALPTWDSAHTTVTIAWQSDDPLLVPRLERRLGEGDPWRVAVDWLPAGTTSVQDTPPDPGLSYEYRIRVRDHIGQQAYSEPVTTP